MKTHFVFCWMNIHIQPDFNLKVEITVYIGLYWCFGTITPSSACRNSMVNNLIAASCDHWHKKLLTIDLHFRRFAARPTQRLNKNPRYWTNLAQCHGSLKVIAANSHQSSLFSLRHFASGILYDVLICRCAELKLHISETAQKAMRRINFIQYD